METLISCDSRGRFGVIILNDNNEDNNQQDKNVAFRYYTKMFLGTFVNNLHLHSKRSKSKSISKIKTISNEAVVKDIILVKQKVKQ